MRIISGKTHCDKDDEKIPLLKNRRIELIDSFLAKMFTMNGLVGNGSQRRNNIAMVRGMRSFSFKESVGQRDVGGIYSTFLGGV